MHLVAWLLKQNLRDSHGEGLAQSRPAPCRDLHGGVLLEIRRVRS